MSSRLFPVDMNNPLAMNGVQPGLSAQAMQQMKANGAATRANASDLERMNRHKRSLNTAIYDYFLKMEMYDMCRHLKNSGAQLELDDGKNAPKQEEDGQDSSNRPADLPLAIHPWRSMQYDTSHLLDWFSMFWDMWQLSAQPNKGPDNQVAMEYQKQVSHQKRLQHSHQQQLMRSSMPSMTPQQQHQQQMSLLRSRGIGLTPQQQQQVQQQQQMMARKQQLVQAGMHREGSGMDGDGQRPRTPMSGENVPSPKRQRLDGNPQLGGGLGMLNGAPTMDATGRMVAVNGIQHPLTPAQIAHLQQAKPQHANMVGQGNSPIMPPGSEAQMLPGGGGEFYSNSRLPGAAGGNPHPLQDYQMQLMLLERQNRKRLESAKQENNLTMDGQAAHDGSPMPDGSMGQRPSPNSINYQQMPPGAMENGMQIGPNGIVRPPSSHPNFPNGPVTAGMVRNGLPGQMNGAGFQQGQQGPMGPGAQQGPAQIGTPQQRNSAMPPPQGMPPSNQNVTGRAPSPAHSAAASTPQQSNKPNPKKKAEPKKDRKAPSKKAAAAAAAENQDSAPTTSTPATPITAAVANPSGKGAANQANNQGAQASGGAQSGGNATSGGSADPTAAAAGANSANNVAGLGFGIEDDMSMAFTNPDLNANDVLESFNFDSFIEDTPQDLTMNLDFAGFDPSLDNEGVGV